MKSKISFINRTMLQKNVKTLLANLDTVYNSAITQRSVFHVEQI